MVATTPIIDPGTPALISNRFSTVTANITAAGKAHDASGSDANPHVLLACPPDSITTCKAFMLRAAHGNLVWDPSVLFKQKPTP